MGILTVIPKFEVFTSIPDLSNALRIFEEKQGSKMLETIGKVFVKHNAWTDFGLSLTHRHFDMSSREVLVFTVDNKEKLSVATPWTIEGNSAFPPKLLKLNPSPKAEKLVVPYNWRFTTSGEIIPFEYISTDEFAVPPSPEFVAEVLSALQEFGLETLIGLRRIDDIQHSSAWETTCHKMRANVSILSVEQPQGSEKMVQVGWRFDKEGRLCAEGLMCYDCGDDDGQWCSDDVQRLGKVVNKAYKLSN